RSATCRVMVMKYWCQLGRSLIARVSRDDPDRLRDEGEDEDGERGARRDHAREAERPRVVLARRVPERQHDRGDRRPEEPARPAANAEPEERGEEQRRQQARPAADDRVEHVAPVELAGRQQVQRGDEEPDPARESDRMQHDGVRIGAEDEAREERGQQRVAQLEGVLARRRREHRREPEADGGGERGGGGDKAVEEREASDSGDGLRPRDHLGLAHELRLPTVTGSPTRAPRTALAEPSRTAISRSPQLFTTATAWPRATAPY